MSDSLQESDGAAPSGPGGGDIVSRIVQSLRRGDVVLALGIICILSVLILPLPKWMLDIALALSITFSVLILMTALFIERPLEFSSVPTVLLIATMLRLSLNLASTRLILSNGHEGAGAAGRVIEAFGGFVMGGNFVIGLIVFAILVIVNFIVITKGSGRIAEVSARFSLDAMPGKQMAIDADLSAGLIDEDSARSRRKEIEDESTFFGAMDGAAKFVRGDAVAGLLIVFINIVGGIIIGVAQMDLSLADASRSYTMLTVGDGLVSQIPALIVSTAAGLLVSKSGVVGSADKALFGQLSSYPRAMGVSAFLMIVLSLLPGIPMLPFLLVAGAFGTMAALSMRKNDARLAVTAAAEAEAAAVPPMDEPIGTALRMDLIRLELGYGLVGIINSEKGERMTDQIKALRRQLAGDAGFVMPAVRIQDNMQLPPNAYVVRIKEIDAGNGELRANMLLAMDPKGAPIELPGEDTQEPTFGLPAKWIADANREEALFKGLTVVDPSTVITTHLTEVIKDNMSELLSYAETQKLLDELDAEHQKLAADLIPDHITLSGLQRVLQNLLAERVSIRDLPTILEGVFEAAGATRNVTIITEHVRSRLARQISESNTSDAGFVSLVTLSPEWEQNFGESIVGQGEERQLAMAPTKLQDFITRVRETFERHAIMGEAPALLTSPGIRPFVRSIVERVRPTIVVMSQSEVYAKARIKTVDQI